MKLYAIFLGVILFVMVSFGWILPSLFTSNNIALFCVGIMYLFGVVPLVCYGACKWIRSLFPF